MKRRSRLPILPLACLVILATTATASASGIGSRPPLAGFDPGIAVTEKDHPVRQRPGAPDGREGGETIDDPFFVEVLPFLDAGNTCDNLDDYDETCPYGDSISPDVVYVYIPPDDQLLTVDLCGSQYDTKVYVYEGVYTPGEPLACNDDYYTPGDPCGAWVSRLDAVPVTAGVPYFVVVDGWGGDCGDYQILIDEGLPPPQFDLSFAQLTYGFAGFPDVESSTMGRASVTFARPDETVFLNVAAFIPDVSVNAEWIVRNLLLPGAGFGPPVEQLAVRYRMDAMSVANGDVVPGLAYGYTLTPDPLNDAEVSAWYDNLALQGPDAVAQERIDVRGYLGPDESSVLDVGDAQWWLAYEGDDEVVINSAIGCDMPNVQLDSTRSPETDWNGCAPAACANSLTWLKDQHPEIDFPPDLRETFEQLSNLMNRLAREGASSLDIIKAKLDFIEAHDLPIHVKYQAKSLEGDIASTSGESEASDGDDAATDFPDRDWIESESAAGEDVELGVGFYYVYQDTLRRDGGHAVVVTGTETVNGVPKIKYKHDTAQEDSTGTVQETSDIDELGDTGVIHLPGLDGWIRPAPGADPVPTVAIVESAFSESYDPSVTGVPSTHTYDAYCGWFKRTIPPGKKLRITFPGGYARCENVAVYRLDRTVDPPQWIKVQVWNNNNDQIREWVNETDAPVTIAVHNDDKYEYQDKYVPYEVEVEIVDAEDGDENSPSNEEEYGGFSLGGTDGGNDEFGDPVAQSVAVDGSLGVVLADVPGRLADAGGATQTLTLTHPIPVWNPYWENLGVVIRPSALASPGQLTVDCPTTGDVFTLDVVDTELIELELTALAPVTGFEITLEASSGLDLSWDFVGFPSLTPFVTAAGEDDLPRAFALEAAQPNPFNPATRIRFAVPRAGEVRLDVFDVSGRLVTNLVHGDLPAGRHEVTWSGDDRTGRPVATGVYVYRLESGGQVLTRKMTLVK